LDNSTFTMTYKKGVLSITQDEETTPFVLQPNFPDGTKWESEAQAKEWGAILITSITDPTSPLPGDSPTEMTKPRPVVTIEPEDPEVSVRY